MKIFTRITRISGKIHGWVARRLAVTPGFIPQHRTMSPRAISAHLVGRLNLGASLYSRFGHTRNLPEFW